MPLTPHTRFNLSQEKLWGSMPFRERRVLMVVLAQGTDNLFKVSDLTNLSALGSQITIHTCLNRLIESGHLKHSSNPGFGATKFITLTRTSKTLFIKLNRLFLRCGSLN